MTDPIRPTPDEAAAIKAACESCVFYKCEYPGCEEPKGCVTPRIVRAALAADEAARAKAEPSADASYWATRAWIKAQGVLAQGGSGDAAVDQIALALESYAQRAKAEPQPSQSAADLWRDLCEKDDRTSPEEYPDMALITEDELTSLAAHVRREALEQAAREIENHWLDENDQLCRFRDGLDIADVQDIIRGLKG